MTRVHDDQTLFLTICEQNPQTFLLQQVIQVGKKNIHSQKQWKKRLWMPNSQKKKYVPYCRGFESQNNESSCEEI